VPTAPGGTHPDSGAPAWIAALQARASQPPLRPREPLAIGAAGVALIGSIEPQLARTMAAAGLPMHAIGAGWRVAEPADESLARLARWLDEHRLGSRWRNELLAVTDLRGERHASIERAAVRPLGITTHAVHLVGWTPDGALWVQQRAHDKSTDPGLWDTMMGGLVTAGESIVATLARETEEEAGLAVDALEAVMPAGRITIRRPVSDGYMIEHIEVYEAVVPRGVEPANRDGEVERFEALAPADLVARLQADAFTLEAALILVEALRRRGLLDGRADPDPTRPCGAHPL
jgi:8-oxo-dGTP pyrophosphatase MutT (NUDIX family)